MIIDPTDFNDRPYKIPNQEEARDLSSLLAGWEESLADGTIMDECCTLMGGDLWEAFMAGLQTSGVIEDRWLRLRDGAEYDYAGKTYKYRGWVDTIRPGVYAKWIPTTTWKLTNIGYVENSAPDKSKLIEDPYPFIVENWNKFARSVGYKSECGYNCINSLYGFMKVNESDYPDWIFKCPTFKNRHDF